MERAIGDESITELLTVGMLATGVAAVLLWVRRRDGSWKFLCHALRTPTDDSRLRDVIVKPGQVQPVEIRNLRLVLADSPLLDPPDRMRWACGLVLRDDAGQDLGVLVLLDRAIRKLDRSLGIAFAAFARRIRDQLRAPPVVPVGESGGRHDNPIRDDPPPPPPPPPPLPSPPAQFLPATSIPDGPDVLRVSEVARIFQVTPRTINNWARDGKIPSFRTRGGHLRFRRSDLVGTDPHA